MLKLSVCCIFQSSTGDMQLRQSSTMFGFETLFITVGGVVNQDQNLAQIGGTDATVDVSPLDLLPSFVADIDCIVFS